MIPSQAPSASSSCKKIVLVGNKGPKSNIPVSAAFLAVQGRLLSGKFTRKSPEIRFSIKLKHLKGASWLALKGQVKRSRLRRGR